MEHGVHVTKTILIFKFESNYFSCQVGHGDYLYNDVQNKKMLCLILGIFIMHFQTLSATSYFQNMCFIIEELSYGGFICIAIKNNKIAYLILCFSTTHFQYLFLLLWTALSMRGLKSSESNCVSSVNSRKISGFSYDTNWVNGNRG